MKKDRRDFFKKSQLLWLVPWMKFSFNPRKQARITADRVYFTNGIKVCETFPGSLMVWTRLCAVEEPVPITTAREKQPGTYYPIDFDEEQPVELMDGAVRGKSGKVRLKISHGDSIRTTDWYDALAGNDYTVRIPVNGLKSGQVYTIEVEAKSLMDGEVNSVVGKFQTAPAPAAIAPVTFTTSTCQYLWNYDDVTRGFKTYDSMSRLNPDFFVHTGDYVYYDRIGPMVDHIDKARHKWHAMNSRLSIREFLQKTPMYMIKDDHDLLRDDTYPDSQPLGNFTLEEGLRVWQENVPFEGLPYRTVRWGKDLQLWMVEGREYRTERNVAEETRRTIWGAEQKEWFEKTFLTSDATFKILFSATPIVGPDRENKKDNHANALFQEEGDWLRNLLSSRPGTFVINGDRHWQYVSVDSATGLREFGSGAVSDSHAGGWNQNDWREEHRYLRVKGGFLSVNVFRENERPRIDFIHHDVDGNIMHKEMVKM